MIERLKKISAHYNLSPAAFADQIGVSRPVMSHVFSERNKPSLEVVQKTGLAFPEIDPGWLLYGNGEMLKKIAISENIISPLAVDDSEEKRATAEKLPGEQSSENPINTESQRNNNNSKAGSKKIERIVLFFDDKTFVEYQP